MVFCSGTAISRSLSRNFLHDVRHKGLVNPAFDGRPFIVLDVTRPRQFDQIAPETPGQFHTSFQLVAPNFQGQNIATLVAPAHCHNYRHASSHNSW